MEEKNERDLNPVQEVINKIKSSFDVCRQFLATKNAVLKGEELYTLDNKEIIDKGYLTPWKFNAFETLMTGAFATVTTKIIQVSMQVKPTNEVQDEIIVDERFTAILNNVSSWVDPFIIPVLLTSVVFLFAWGSLKGKDSSKEKRRLTRRAYLYFDGAYGLYSQLILAFGVGVFSSGLSETLFEDHTSPYLGWGFLLLLLVAFYWQIIISMKKLPKLIFLANGYTDRAKHFWQKSEENDPPWNRLVFAHIISGYPLSIVVGLLFFSISFLISYFLYFVGGLFGA